MGDDEKGIDMRRLRMARWLCLECGKQYEGQDDGRVYKCTDCGTNLLKQYWFRLGWPHLHVVK